MENEKPDQVTLLETCVRYAADDLSSTSSPKSRGQHPKSRGQHPKSRGQHPKSRGQHPKSTGQHPKCMKCAEEERKHPDYQLAADAELAAVRSGNRNFAGLGWPGKNGRIKR